MTTLNTNAKLISTNFRKSMTEIAAQNIEQSSAKLAMLELAQAEAQSSDIIEKLRLQAKGHDTKAKRLKALAELNNKAEKLLREQIKAVGLSDDEVSKIASYGLDKVIQLVNALADDRALVMQSESDNKRNIAFALDYMQAKKRLSVSEQQLQRETGHRTATQAGYIRRTLVALKVCEQHKDADLGMITVFSDNASPISEKIKTLYSGIAEALNTNAQIADI